MDNGHTGRRDECYASKENIGRGSEKKRIDRGKNGVNCNIREKGLRLD